MNSKEELVKAHKIVALCKMDDLTYTHISIIGNRRKTFSISPFGVRFKDVKLADLLDFTMEGTLLPPQRAEDIYDHLYLIFNKKRKTAERNFNKTGFAIHSSIYKTRSDVGAIIHLHTAESIAVSTNPEGLLPISQHALHFYDRVSYHNYDSLNLTPKEEESLFIKDLGQNNVMFLRNHGFITVGKTLEEALFYAYHLQRACSVQVIAPQNPILPAKETCEKARDELLSFEKSLGRRDFNSYIL